ncbi:electron transport complex protein RnfG [Mariprofundus micogutta]|uniref:Ion-translocating oxidoreductase complex subunit G n=1 Tax=Mariprofundus micogutta TaxID=1921010 RepID=A0A1L8CQ03_9PROT|nr:RnfABCDGE type electron transport complex subunit G [Mariprofundus micogutta]GAV20964.1 electron transport complex protein RnfG [Mariprofundus micogutta]
MKFDREQIQMVMALFVVAAVAAVLLGLTDMLTREPIAQAEKEALHKALTQVLPAHANDAQSDMFKIGKDKQAVSVYPGKTKTGRISGFAWEVIARDGYAGSIRILVGVSPDGNIHAIRVTSHKETPGLGDGIVNNDSWLAAFVDQTIDSRNWKVKKDGGDFDQFTGATITPRAVVKAVSRALQFFNSNRELMLATVNGEKSGGAK